MSSEKLIILEDNGTLSFGDYSAGEKIKLPEFKVNEDTYYVKTFFEITRLEKNGKMIYESVPGSNVHNFKMSEHEVVFDVEGNKNLQITLELEPKSDYRIKVDDRNIGSVDSGVSGKISFNVETNKFKKSVKIEKL